MYLRIKEYIQKETVLILKEIFTLLLSLNYVFHANKFCRHFQTIHNQFQGIRPKIFPWPLWNTKSYSRRKTIIPVWQVPRIQKMAWTRIPIKIKKTSRIQCLAYKIRGTRTFNEARSAIYEMILANLFNNESWKSRQA